MSITPLTAEHREQVLSHFSRLSFEDVKSRFLMMYSKSALMQFVNEINFVAHYIFGIFAKNEENEKPLLVAVAFVNDAEGKKGTKEIALSVDAEFRGKGFGLALMQEGIRYTKENGYTHLVLTCLKDNDSLKRLARKCGFYLKNDVDFQLEGTLKV